MQKRTYIFIFQKSYSTMMMLLFVYTLEISNGQQKATCVVVLNIFLNCIVHSVSTTRQPMFSSEMQSSTSLIDCKLIKSLFISLNIVIRLNQLSKCNEYECSCILRAKNNFESEAVVG